MFRSIFYYILIDNLVEFILFLSYLLEAHYICLDDGQSLGSVGNQLLDVGMKMSLLLSLHGI
jgi:hypothetical protein